jgi:1-phosphatidylinositol-3-phosphate 5-kinase
MALRHNFHQIEQSLYTLLAKTSDDSLNEARRTFLSTGRGTQKRLSAWQRKHLGPKAKLVGDLVAEEPVWWSNDCHVVPRGNIIVRENDWGSIIAHTLRYSLHPLKTGVRNLNFFFFFPPLSNSTPDYQLELFKFSTARSSSSGSQPNTPLTSPPEHTPSSSSSFFSGYKLFTYGSRNQPDPDQEGVVWNEPEQYHSVISRKESSRGHASRLGMRDILVRQKTLLEPSSSGGVSTPVVVRGLSNSSAHAVFAKAKSDVEAGNGKVDDALADRFVLQELGSVTTSPPSSVKSAKSSPALPDSWLHTEREEVPSVESGESEETVRQDKGQDNIPPLPPKDFVLQEEFQEKEVVDPSIRSKEAEGDPATSSSFATAVASGISSAMRFITNTELPLGTTVSSPSNAKHHHHHHALLLADISNMDERPHIKYDWTIGKRLKFSCTVYYAKQFDALRRRCEINDLFLKSLISSVNWSAQGGKSRSNFWKTSDDRFIIKSLVNAWNVADLYVFIHVYSHFLLLSRLF